MRTSVHLTKSEAAILLQTVDPDRAPAADKGKLYMVVGRVWSGLNGLHNGSQRSGKHPRKNAVPKK